MNCTDKHRRTREAFLGTRLLNTPFWALFNMIPFILFKDLIANDLQIVSVLALKPAVSLIALYWIGIILKRQDRLRRYIMFSHFLGYLPFFFFPFINDPWFVVFAFGFYMTMYRSAIPAWMEVLKLNVPGASRSKIFAFGTAAGYIGDAVWPLILGMVLDGYHEAWRWVFPVTAFVGMLAVWLQSRIKVDYSEQSIPNTEEVRTLATPWRNAKDLLSQSPDFMRFQIGFMLGGAGLMIIQPALPQFFMGTLELSYTKLGVAITLCKGVGIACASQYWARLIHKIDIFRFAAIVTLVAALFPLCIFISQFHIGWLYFGYVLYGMMQSGSELSWNMSGPIFSREEDSSSYTSVNILTQGIRGLIIPALGGVLCSQFGPFSVMIMGTIFCLQATFMMYLYSRRALEKGNVFSLPSN
jgi:MFS family permease